MKSSYAKLTEGTKNAIKANARKNVEKMRESGEVKPLSFSTLDSTYSKKFHDIFDGLKAQDPTTTKLSTFKTLVDNYEDVNLNPLDHLKFVLEEMIWHFNKELRSDTSEWNDFCKGAVFGSMQTLRSLLRITSGYYLNEKQKKYIDSCIDNSEIICENKLFIELKN